jgi:hypothetical protein
MKKENVLVGEASISFYSNVDEVRHNHQKMTDDIVLYWPAR